MTPSHARLPVKLACFSKPTDPDDVNEAGYFAANPELRDIGLSARTHFIAAGRAEGRTQAVNTDAIHLMREAKLRRLHFHSQPPDRLPGQPVNFLSRAAIAEFAIPDSPPVSSQPYPASVIELVAANPNKLFLDVGAGLRPDYYPNVVNTEIYPSLSTDVLCVGEAMPFADEQFDFVFCFATLEHTKRPWDVAHEICRVLKPGGTVMIDYPFLQPVHGYPHHYFNATPMGNRSLFEAACDIRSVQVGWHQHPMIALQWSLTVFRNGLPRREARQFEKLAIRDLLDRPVESLLVLDYCRNLHPDMQRVIASGSMLEAVKKPGLAPLSPLAASAATAVATCQDADAVSHDQDIDAIKRDNRLLQSQVDALHRSTSWRATSPLRAIGRLMRRRWR